MCESTYRLATYEDVRVVLLAAYEATHTSYASYSRYHLHSVSLSHFIWGSRDPICLKRLSMTERLYAIVTSSLKRLGSTDELSYDSCD